MIDAATVYLGGTRLRQGKCSLELVLFFLPHAFDAHRESGGAIVQSCYPSRGGGTTSERLYFSISAGAALRSSPFGTWQAGACHIASELVLLLDSFTHK